MERIKTVYDARSEKLASDARRFGPKPKTKAQIRAERNDEMLPQFPSVGRVMRGGKPMHYAMKPNGEALYRRDVWAVVLAVALAGAKTEGERGAALYWFEVEEAKARGYYEPAFAEAHARARMTEMGWEKHPIRGWKLGAPLR